MNRAITVLWPAFLMAGVADMLVFAVLDPLSLTGLGGAALGWSRPAVHTVTFFIFWVLFAAAGLLTLMLDRGRP